MTVAVDELQLSPLDHAELSDYLDRAAHAMVNTFDDPHDSSPPSDAGRSSLL
jgi:truncated hemoglobin YjbI